MDTEQYVASQAFGRVVPDIVMRNFVLKNYIGRLAMRSDGKELEAPKNVCFRRET